MIHLKSKDAIEEDSEAVLDFLIDNRRLFTTNDESFDKYRLSLAGRAGVYAVFCDEALIYVGKTKDASARFRDHFVRSSPSTASKIKEFEALLSSDRKVEIAFCELPVQVYSAIEEALIHWLNPELNQRAS